ncbi:hypothetical protein GBAR_LOCUS26604, partial [Geodia barretti]
PSLPSWQDLLSQVWPHWSLQPLVPGWLTWLQEQRRDEKTIYTYSRVAAKNIMTTPVCHKEVSLF